MKRTADGGWRRLAPRVAVFAALLVSLAATLGVVQAQAAKNGKVLILAPTVSGGASSDEAQAAALIGLGVDVVTNTTWASMTTADFAQYQAIILGDPNCGSLGSISAAMANTAVWGPAIDGNVITIGTDERFHRGQGGLQVTQNAVAFAADAVNKTGMMVSLSCYYHDTPAGTPVPVLAPFGTFTATGVGCYNDAHIVATHPALTGLTDASLSNWSCSVHEAFDSFPSDFLPLAIAEDPPGGTLPGSRNFPDGTKGVPYILARGEGLRLVRQIDLTPDTATNPIRTSHTLTATVRENGVPMPGKTVAFTVLSGPNAGTSGSSATDGAGQATFTYTDAAGPGTDSIQASYVDSAGATQLSNVATKTWGTGAVASTPTPPADIGVTKSDAPDPVSVGSNLTYTLVVTNHGPGPAPNAELSDTLPAGVTFVSVSTTVGSCAVSTGTVRCSFGTLALNQMATVTIVVRVDQAGTIVNSAGVSTSVSDPNVANNQIATALTTVQGAFTPPATPETPVVTGCALTTGTPSVFAGVRSVVSVRARYDDGSARAGVALTLRGAGKAQTVRTNAQGLARFTVVPKRAGRLTVRGADCGVLAVAAAMSQSCAALSVTPKSATVGGATVLTVRIRIAGKPAVGVRVLARGAGLSASAVTNSAGLASLRGTATQPGVVSITVPGVLSCTKRVGVSGAFQPPEVTG